MHAEPAPPPFYTCECGHMTRWAEPCHACGKLVSMDVFLEIEELSAELVRRRERARRLQAAVDDFARSVGARVAPTIDVT